MPGRLIRQKNRSAQWAAVSLWTTTAVARLIGTYGLVQGLTVAWYGPDRWRTSPALAPALQVPGQTTTWGITLALAGLLCLWGSLTRHMAAAAVGQYVAAVWSLFFTLAQAVAVSRSEHTPTTGVVVYALVALLQLTLAAGAWRLRK